MCGCDGSINGPSGIDMELIGGLAIGSYGSSYLDETLTKVSDDPQVTAALKVAGGIYLSTMENGSLMEGIGLGLASVGLKELGEQLMEKDDAVNGPKTYPNAKSIQYRKARHSMPNQALLEQRKMAAIAAAQRVQSHKQAKEPIVILT